MTPTLETDTRIPLPTIRASEGTTGLPIVLEFFQGLDTSTPLDLTDVTGALARFGPDDGSWDPSATIIVPWDVTSNRVEGTLPEPVTDGTRSNWVWSVTIEAPPTRLVLGPSSVIVTPAP